MRLKFIRCQYFQKHYYSSFPYLLTPRCRVLLEQLTGLQLVKKFPKCHGTRMFITALTSVRQISLSCASPVQSIYPHPTSWRSILIISTHLRLGLPSGSFLPVQYISIHTKMCISPRAWSSKRRLSTEMCVYSIECGPVRPFGAWISEVAPSILETCYIPG